MGTQPPTSDNKGDGPKLRRHIKQLLSEYELNKITIKFLEFKNEFDSKISDLKSDLRKEISDLRDELLKKMSELTKRIDTLEIKMNFVLWILAIGIPSIIGLSFYMIKLISNLPVK